MRVEKTYYAFDETEFDDEGSCIAYENRVLALWDSVDTFDSEFNLGEKGSETALEDAYYIVVKDEENAKSFIQWVNSVYGFNFPDEDIVDCRGERNHLLRRGSFHLGEPHQALRRTRRETGVHPKDGG